MAKKRRFMTKKRVVVEPFVYKMVVIEKTIIIEKEQKKAIIFTKVLTLIAALVRILLAVFL